MRNFSVALSTLFALLSLNSCGAATDQEGLPPQIEVATTQAAIKNGTVLPNGAPLAGTVLLRIWSYDANKWGTCSGQISSRNTIVTAAHCFTDDSFSGTSASWPVYIQKQTSAGFQWVSPTQAWAWMDVDLNPSYWNATKTSYNSVYDFAVIHSDTDWINTVENDTAMFLKGSYVNTTAWALGHGQYDHGSASIDYQLRGAKFFVARHWSDFYLHTVPSGSNRPMICPGDSGGPLKVKLFNGAFVLGVASFTTGGGEDDCGTTNAWWARTDKNWQWLVETIDNCSDGISFIRCW
jgi:hypothetical protein